MDIDYTRSEVDVIVDLIRHDNGNKPLSSAQVSFGTPTTFNPIPAVQRNTVVMATAIPGLGFRDGATFYYNRVKLPDFIPPDNPNILTFDKGDFTKLSDLLPDLNLRLSINLTADMIIEASLPTFQEDDGFDYKEIALTVRPNSLVYLEMLTLKINRAVVTLVSAIPDPSMDGLTYAAPV